ncbi:MAG: capsule assembly Wzi family protein [Christiangramia sp.]|nr:capsule assembly Wzi family protein [Christiangramia sp.]
MNSINKKYRFIKSAGWLFALLFFCQSSSAQLDYAVETELNGMLSTQQELPFWFYSNQRGRISEETNFSGLLLARMDYRFNPDLQFEIGSGIFYQDAFNDKIFLDELYAQVNYKWLEFIIGRKQEIELYNGLSATNENFAWSLNARPMPGLQVQSSRPVYLGSQRRIGIEFSLEEYLMEKDRYVKDTRLHSKSLFLNYNFSNSWKLKLGLSHYAQWGGYSPDTGQQPESFANYLKVFTGREGGEDAIGGDKANATGNHLGVYELYLTKEYAGFEVELIYNHFFEDGSGSRYANFSDGRYGLYYKNRYSESFIEAIMYEFYYTKNQSKNGPHNYDAYFNHYLTYNSGWTYQNRVIGVPFFKFDSEDGKGVIDDKFLAHHIGWKGEFSTFRGKRSDYKVKLSFLDYEHGADSTKALYFLGELGLLKDPLQIRLNIGLDLTEGDSAVQGVGLRISKQLL